MIPLSKFLKQGGELAVDITVPDVVAGLKNAGGSIYISEDDVYDGVTSTLHVTLHHDNPLETLDYILRTLKADEMSVEKYAEMYYIRLWWD